MYQHCHYHLIYNLYSNTSLCFFLNPLLTPKKKWQTLSEKEKKFSANVRYIKICLFLHQILHLDRKKYHEINSLKIFRLLITFRCDCRKKVIFCSILNSRSINQGVKRWTGPWLRVCVCGGGGCKPPPPQSQLKSEYWELDSAHLHPYSGKRWIPPRVAVFFAWYFN